MAGVIKATGRLAVRNTALLVCDVQERFRDVIHAMPSVIHTCSTMIQGAKVLGMPVFITEQYPKALGPTVKELQDLDLSDVSGVKIMPKTQFSMAIPEMDEALEQLRGGAEIKSVILCGIETHVCVLQTALDFIENGFQVHVLVDGVSSQRHADRTVALRRLQQAGVFISTSEMVLFQLLGDAKNPKFKEISALVKVPRPDPHLGMGSAFD